MSEELNGTPEQQLAYVWHASWYAHMYYVTKNPLFLWWMYRFARRCKQPVPEPVLAYLDECADALLDLEADPKKMAEEVQGALQLRTGKQGKSFFNQMKSAERRYLIMREVFISIARGGANIDKKQVFQNAADDYCVAFETIQNWYYQDRSFFSNSPN